MSIFRIPFQAFFQPRELEIYLSRSARTKKRVALAHIALAVVWYALYATFFFNFRRLLDVSKSDVFPVTLTSILSIYIVTLSIAMVSGGVFKRDMVLSFVIGTYWGILTSVFWVPILIVGRIAERFLTSLILVFGLTLMATIITDVAGRTKGFRIAFLFSLCVACLIAAIFTFSEKAPIPYNFIVQDVKTGRKDIAINSCKHNMSFYGIFLGSAIETQDEYNVYNVSSNGQIIATTPPYYSWYRSPSYSDRDSIFREALSLKGYKLPAWSFFHNDSLYALPGSPEFELSRFDVSSASLGISVIQQGKPTAYWSDTLAGTWLFDPIVLDHGMLFLQTDREQRVVRILDGTTSWKKVKEDWFTNNDFPDNLSAENWQTPFVIDSIVFGLSPSLSLFGVNGADGKIMFVKSIYGDQLRDFRIKTPAYMTVYYAALFTFLLSSGLYRLPMYAFESFVHVFLVCVFAVFPHRKNLPKFIRKTPLFFDHISTLPLPAAKPFLRQIAKVNPGLCAEKLNFLLEKTHQERLAARFFGEFHGGTKEFLFRDMNRSCQTDGHQSVSVLAKKLRRDDAFGNLVRSYEKLLHGPIADQDIRDHATILSEYAQKGYKHGAELHLVYQMFDKFRTYRSIGEIAAADRSFAELMQMSYNDLLNPRLMDIINVIAELTNDLKNYEIVDSFRDKQYYLSEARIKLYEIQRRVSELYDPERVIMLSIIEQWQSILVAESKALRGPAELELLLLSRTITSLGEWNAIVVSVRNSGQSPAENIHVRLLENENLSVKEAEKVVRLLGTEEATELEFSVLAQGNPTELRMYFDTVFDDFQRKGKLRPYADIIRLEAAVEEFRRIPNPYVVGTPLQSDKVFFGRKEAIDFAVNNLSVGAQNNVLIFFGQRRVGKSSILYRLIESPLSKDYVCVYVDCQGFAGDDTGRLLYRLCRGIQERASRDHITLEQPDLARFKDNTFLELDAYLDKVDLARGDKKVALMFDEYEFLESTVKDGRVDAKIFDKLRNLMQHRNTWMAFIFVGTHRLTELTEDYWSFLFNIALYHEIGSLGKDEAQALVTEPVKGYMRYDQLAVDKILRVTGLHPYFIQVTCRLIVNYCNQNRKTYITLTDVNEVIKEAVEGSTAHVKYLFKDYSTKSEQEVLAFLSLLTDESKLFSSATEISRLASDYEFSYEIKQLREILSGLKSKRLVREDGEYRGELYGFEYEFLRLWITQHVSIQKGFVSVT